jgi:hypothetical protein
LDAPRPPKYLVAILGVRIFKKRLRKSILALSKELAKAEETQYLRHLAPLIVQGLAKGPTFAKVTYARVYTPHRRYHAEVGNQE